MHAQNKPAHISDPAAKKSREGASAEARRGPREDDKSDTKSATLAEPIRREPIPGVDTQDEPLPPIIREPDEPETKPAGTTTPIQRPDEEEEA